ncbi:hypothetical protein [Dyella psychrodurans]|uniref:Uncharacterized protein n=1 Tax=Dyella psychrodurans TaxID=1927960 RepID=A0A370XEC6_9GAMM|nr:hypothetical protein [Dyella psychrodurans]RDS86652.1 hypothetical protein DWU99_05330 [Dyella psychrodurans]
MTVRELVSVGLRFFALWLLLAAFQTFEMLMSVQRTMHAEANLVGIRTVVSSIGLGIALLVATAALLWITCRPLGYVITRGAVSPQNIHLTPHGIVTAGCALLGLWGLKESLIPLIKIWVLGALNSQLSDTSILGTLSIEQKINATSQLAELGLSLFFLCRPYQISALVLRAGSKKNPLAPANAPLHDTSHPSESQE